jgi:hypothetical protein
MYETTLTVAHSLLNPLWVSETYRVDEDGDQWFVSASVNGHSVCEDAAVGLRISLTQDPPAGVRVTIGSVAHDNPVFDDISVTEHAYRQLVGLGDGYFLRS